MMAESPLPALAIECRLTKAALPRAMAYPSAMPAADRSCSPRTYLKSAGMSRKKGQFRRARIAEDDRHPQLAQDFVGNFSNRAQRHAVGFAGLRVIRRGSYT